MILGSRALRTHGLWLGLLAAAGCDRLTGREEAKQPEASPVEADAPAATEAKALAEAARSVVETKAAPPTPDPPLRLSKLSVKALRDASLWVELEAEVAQPLEASDSLAIKALCKHGDHLVADLSQLTGQFDRTTIGAKVAVLGGLFREQLESPAPCQLEARVRKAGGKSSVPFGRACWNGTTATLGPCTPALAVVAPTEASTPVEVVGLERHGFGGLTLAYLLRLNEAPTDDVHLTIKAACRVGAKTIADVRDELVSADPSSYAAGDVIARRYGLFRGSAPSFAEPASHCDLTTWLRPAEGTPGAPEEIVIDESCERAGTITDGRCEPTAPPPPAPTDFSIGSVTLDEVTLALREPGFALEIAADVAMEKTVAPGSWITAEASCTGSEGAHRGSVGLLGPALHHLRPGEAVRLIAPAFALEAFGGERLATKPKRCKVELYGGSSSGPKREAASSSVTSSTSASAVLLGTYCLENGAVTKC